MRGLLLDSQLPRIMKIEPLPGSVVASSAGNPTPHRCSHHRPAGPHSAASASSGESRAIQRESIRAHPQIAHDHGNSLSGSNVAHGAAIERNLRINACDTCNGLHCGTAQYHLRLPLRRDKPAIQAPAIGAWRAIGSVKRKLPSP